MITILDYGSGNIHAIATLVKLSNIDFEIADDPKLIQKATKIILPGVGAFDNAMSAFQNSGMADALKERLSTQQASLLGICVGMHVLGNSSEEGSEQGLGLIPGSVKKFQTEHIESLAKIPHMGWNSLILKDQDHPLFKNIDCHRGFYFLHSYYYDCDVDTHVLGTTDHGKTFHSVVGHDRIYGVQFHPEKSHQNGITLIKNFLEV